MLIQPSLPVEVEKDKWYFYWLDALLGSQQQCQNTKGSADADPSQHKFTTHWFLHC